MTQQIWQIQKFKLSAPPTFLEDLLQHRVQHMPACLCKSACMNLTHLLWTISLKMAYMWLVSEVNVLVLMLSEEIKMNCSDCCLDYMVQQGVRFWKLRHVIHKWGKGRTNRWMIIEKLWAVYDLLRGKIGYWKKW